MSNPSERDDPADTRADAERSTHLTDASTRYFPERVGSYRILGIIGEGAMGVVYEAEQDRPHRRVALKVIRPGFAAPSRLRRFEHSSAGCSTPASHRSTTRAWPTRATAPSRTSRWSWCAVAR